MKKIISIAQIILFLAIAITVSKLTYYLTGFDNLFGKYNNIYYVCFLIMCIQLFYCLENLFLVFVFARVTDKSSLSEIGIVFNKKSIKFFMIGTIFAVLAAIITWLGFLVFFQPIYIFKNKWFLTIFFIVLTIPVTILQATAEELIYRTWMLKKLGNTFSPVLAIIITGLAFGGVHMFNPSYTWFSSLNTCLLGVATGLAYFRTKSVWMASGIHFGWNYFLGLVYLPFIITAEYNGVRVSMFSGGEGTLVGCVAMAGISFAVYYYTKKKTKCCS